MQHVQLITRILSVVTFGFESSDPSSNLRLGNLIFGKNSETRYGTPRSERSSDSNEPLLGVDMGKNNGRQDGNVHQVGTHGAKWGGM